MKKLSVLLLCLALCLTFLPALTSCEPEANQPDDTTPAVDNGTTAPDEDPTEAPTDTPTDTPTGGDVDTPTDDGNGDEIYDSETTVTIGTAEELMAFNKAVNEDGEYFDDMTIIFTADIDMTGYTWVPLDGGCLYGTTFDGQGHTISNLQFADYEPEKGTNAADMGSGFVGVARGDLTFKDLTFKDSKVTAYERAVANFIGVCSADAYLWFENCKSIGFTAEGWTDYGNQDTANGGHPISFRLAGFVGHLMAGNVGFLNCHVEDITLSGFHNMAGFVGYDGVPGGVIDQFAFEGCSVKNAKFYFSYCMSDSYTVDMPRKFVSVFYNGAAWVDNIDAVADPELENTYENIYFYDVTAEDAEYSPEDFRSWTQEEYEASLTAPAA